MFHLFARKSVSLAKVATQLVDQLYQTQRDRLVHTAAAERCSHMGEMCLIRKARLEKELAELSLQPAEKTGLFRRESIGSIVRNQLTATQVEYLDNMSQAEHHDALAVMYRVRASRLHSQIEEMQSVAKHTEAGEGGVSTPPSVNEDVAPIRPSKTDHGDIAQPSWGSKRASA